MYLWTFFMLPFVLYKNGFMDMELVNKEWVIGITFVSFITVGCLA
jgi:hypothetical protein